MRTVLLGNVAQIISGQSPKSSNYNQQGNGLPLYQGKKDFGAMFTTEPKVWTTEVTKIAEKGDILISVRAPVGPVNIASQKMNIGRGLAAIRPSSGLDALYLFRFLQLAEPRIVRLGGGTTFQSINRKHIENIEIPYPNVEDQKKIAQKLEEVFKLINQAKEKTEQKLDDLGELKQSILKRALEGEL